MASQNLYDKNLFVSGDTQCESLKLEVLPDFVNIIRLFSE